MKTIREQIIEAFTERAQSLSTRPVERVRRWQPQGDAVNVSVWDGEETALGNDYDVQRSGFPLALYLQWAVGQGNASVTLNAKLGDVIKTMLGTDPTFSGLAEGIDYTRANPDYPEDGSGLVALSVIFTVTYATVAGDPFQQPD